MARLMPKPAPATAPGASRVHYAVHRLENKPDPDCAMCIQEAERDPVVHDPEVTDD